MNSRLRKNLERKYRDTIDDAARRLLEDDDPVEAAKSVEQVESYRKLLEAAKSKRTERYWALGITALCLLIVGLLWSLRVSSTAFRLNIQGNAVRMRIKTGWRHQESFSVRAEVPAGEIQISGASEIKLEGRSCGADAVISGGKAQLTDLALAADSDLELTAKQDHLQLAGQEGRVQGEVTFVGPVQVQSHDPCTEKKLGKGASDIPQSLVFNSDVKVGQPLLLDTKPPIPWTLTNLEVAGLQFSEETVPGSGEFESSVRSGSMMFFDTLGTVTLQEGDRLRFVDVNGKCSKLWVKDDLNLICELSARKVIVGPPGLERNLSPSYLEYLYHRQSLAFLWGAVTFLCGALWGIRRIIWRSE